MVLIVPGLVSYIVTINSVVSWTHWGGQIGELGRVLDYHMLGESILHHVTKENLKGQPLFSFLDFTSYFLAELIALNDIATLTPGLEKCEPGGIHVQRLAVLSLLLAAFGMLIFESGTMMFNDSTFRQQLEIGGGELSLLALCAYHSCARGLRGIHP